MKNDVRNFLRMLSSGNAGNFRVFVPLCRQMALRVEYTQRGQHLRGNSCHFVKLQS